MKKLYVSVLIALLCIKHSCNALDDVRGPPDGINSFNKKSQTNDRKSSEILDTNEVNDQEDSEVESVDADSDEISLDDFPFSRSAIKIIKAPEDLAQDEKINEIINKIMVDLHSMQTMESTITNIDRIIPITSEQEEHVELTPQELEAQNLYETAMAILNKTKSDKVAGLAVMVQAAKKGHAMAKAKVAWAQLMGNPVDLNIEEARKTFLELAENGLPDAHMGLGFMYASGVGFNVSQAKAIVHYTMAAIGDNSWAQMVMGYRYWAGVSLPNSCEKALDYYCKVATKVAAEVTFSGGAAVHRIRLLDEIENTGPSSGILDNDLIEYYQLLADKGDVQAQIGLGQLHYQGGRGISLDHQKALQYFTQAANAGNAVAMAFLGKIYLEGSENIKADNETAFKYFKKAADLGNPVGQSGLGIMYLEGKSVPKDTGAALRYFTQSADQGWVDGQLQLGNMYLTGTGVKRDFRLANKYFSLASQSGHVLAFFMLGQMHAVGLGMIRSCPTAVELFKNVAERGKWSERLMAAHHDYRSYKFDESFMQYTLMAELGYEVAQSNAAFLLDRNEVKMFKYRQEELVRALQYWGRAAAQGYSAAQVKMGDYHYYGLGTLVDYETAASHYRMASEQQHNAQAMFNLGYMHEQGLGMKKDIHLAKRCYDLAAETSTDAKVPVTLALLKLQILFKLESLKDTPFEILLQLNENIVLNWDLYLISILTVILGLIIYFQRPPVPVAQAPNNQQPQQQQQQPQQPAPERPPQPNQPDNGQNLQQPPPNVQ